MRRAVLPVCHCFTHPGARARAMLFPRVAALPGIWLLRVRRVQHALSLAGTLPRPVRAVSAGSRALGSVWASDGPVRGRGPEDPREDEEEEELLRVPPLLPFDAQRVCVLHPDVKPPLPKINETLLTATTLKILDPANLSPWFYIPLRAEP